MIVMAFTNLIRTFSFLPPFLLAVIDLLIFALFLNCWGKPRFCKTQKFCFLITSLFLFVLIKPGLFFHVGIYQLILIEILFYLFFSYLWTSAPLQNCIYFSCSYFLLSDGILTLLGFISQKIFQKDLMLEGTVSQMVGADLVLLTLLYLLSRMLLIVMRREEFKDLKIRSTQVPLFLLSLIPYLFIRGIVLWLPVQNEDLFLETPVMLIVTQVLGLTLMISHVNLIASQRHEYELRQMEQVLANQHSQFLEKQKNMETVNQKYHDLKNTILYLRQSSSDEKVQEGLAQMWDQIHSYETCIETGNEAVNIILSEKLSDCQEKGITFTPYLDGHLLDFIEPLDICTILGNALDNAIEASEGIPDPAKRIITLNVLSKNNFLSVSVCNFFQTIPSQINGKLQTTKKDSFSHGYGMQNMQHTAEKYGGHLSYRIKEDLFTLDFLFPFH